jgi:Ca2+-binding RTX toxin-like protein
MTPKIQRQVRRPLLQSAYKQPPMIQPLEGRQLLTATLADGVLAVAGTAQRDDITVSISKDGETITVSERVAKRFKKATATTTEFAAADVTSVVVNAGAANDSVRIMGNKTTDWTIPTSLNGSDGADRLAGGNGADVINGEAGEDDLFGNGGADSLSGGEDDDLVVGGKGIDTLNGDAGDDLLKSAGDEEIDILDGGADSAVTGADDEDQAVTDDDETATNASVVDTEDVIPGGGHHGGPHFGGAGFGLGGPGRGGHR